MSLALHGHHVLLIATLGFITAVLTPNWYTSPDKTIEMNVFQICMNSTTLKSCQWVFSLQSDEPSSFKAIKMIYPILIASFAIACVSISLIGLLLGSWHIERYARENESTWLITLTVVATLFSFLLSCGVWTTILTTNLQQQLFKTSDIRLEDFGFSFWINIGSSGVYLYALIIYLITICSG